LSVIGLVIETCRTLIRVDRPSDPVGIGWRIILFLFGWLVTAVLVGCVFGLLRMVAAGDTVAMTVSVLIAVAVAYVMVERHRMKQPCPDCGHLGGNGVKAQERVGWTGAPEYATEWVACQTCFNPGAGRGPRTQRRGAR
jgi:hypothetical protein